MMRYLFGRLALFLFWVYLAVFPGSTIVVALNRVPEWGTWMGGALLLLQGAAALCWLIGAYGARGGMAALLVFLLAWAVEYIGVVTGMPFGRYTYTGALQPQLFSTVPLAIPCAWLMVATGAHQLATTDDWLPPAVLGGRWSVIGAATLVLLLDLQIEAVATKINQYWVWQDGGLYYGVPAANFVAWWLVGVAMALVVAQILSECGGAMRQASDRASARRGEGLCLAPRVSRLAPRASPLLSRVSGAIPAYLYLLSTLMFTIVNLARGYTIAGLVGVGILLTAALAARRRAPKAFSPGVERVERAD